MINLTYSNNDGLPLRDIPRGGPSALLLSGCTTMYSRNTYEVPSTSNGIPTNNARASAADTAMTAMLLSGCSTVYERETH